MGISQMFDSLRIGAEKLAQQTAEQKNAALESVISSIRKNKNEILSANSNDVKKARLNGTKESLVDRLSLTESRLEGILDSVRVVIAQTDPIGQVESGWTTPGGLQIRKIRVPLGVAAIIYESRPNVTVDAFSLAYKSGNAILLRGSSSALESNKKIVSAIKEGLANSADGIPEAIELADSGSHDDVDEILNAVGKIDVLLPRGGSSLIKMVVSKARIPVIETGSGVCHLFVDESADIKKAVRIAENAKLQRPGVCNAIECVVVHSAVLNAFLPQLVETFAGRAQFRCDERSFSIMSNLCKDLAFPASESDYGFEFLDNILAIKTVDSIDEAIAFINAHNTKHSESICTSLIENARLFQKKIDAACVYVNASTRFTDGSEFGFGAELGISTQKFHVRGPMGLSALTTTKYLIDGEGQIR